MKSRCVGILLLIVGLSHLSALPITHLRMGLGNDWYTMGLGDNLDDGLSFGGHLMVTYENQVFLKVDALSFTDKVTSESRYDQVNLNLSSPLSFLWGPFNSTLTPLLGVTIEGNLDFKRIQNIHHKRINRPTLHLPYDNAKTNAHLNLGAAFQTMLPLGWVQVGLEASYVHTFGWENSLQTGAVIKLGGALTLKGGYSFMEDFGTGATHHTMMDRLSGPTFSYYFDGGLVTNSWIYHKNSGSSYGVFGIDIMQLFQPVTYDHTDFTYSLGVLYDMQGNQNRSFSLAFGPITIRTLHKNGPLKNDQENSERRMNVASWMIGYKMEWEATSLIYPYLKALGGFQRFNLQTSPTDVLLEELRSTLALEAGLKFGRDGQWVVKNNSYHPKLFSSLQYVFDTKAIKEADPTFAKDVGPWIFLLGVGLDIGHDSH